MSLQQIEGLQVLTAGMGGVQVPEGGVHLSPIQHTHMWENTKTCMHVRTHTWIHTHQKVNTHDGNKYNCVDCVDKIADKIADENVEMLKHNCESSWEKD